LRARIETGGILVAKLMRESRGAKKKRLSRAIVTDLSVMIMALLQKIFSGLS